MGAVLGFSSPRPSVLLLGKLSHTTSRWQLQGHKPQIWPPRVIWKWLALQEQEVFDPEK